MSALTAVNRAVDICDLAPGHIRAIAPYQPGKPIAELARELDLDPDIIKLASNENPLGVSPLAMRAMEPAIADVARYPDGNGFELKQALSKRYGVDMAQIVLGNGSNDVLDAAARAFLTPSLEAVYSQHAFAYIRSRRRRRVPGRRSAGARICGLGQAGARLRARS